MQEVLNRNLFFVREHVGVFKAANNYDVLDPESEQIVLECREPHLGLFTKLLRFTDYKRMTPFHVVIRTPDGSPVISVKRGWTFFRSRVQVLDENDQPVGGFKQKLLSIGGAFEVQDVNEQPLCSLKGKWTGWDFKFMGPGGEELAHVTKKWAGIGKELFTTADNYILKISEDVPPGDPLRQLIIGAVTCIDMVLKE